MTPAINSAVLYCQNNHPSNSCHIQMPTNKLYREQEDVLCAYAEVMLAEPAGLTNDVLSAMVDTTSASVRMRQGILQLYLPLQLIMEHQGPPTLRLLLVLTHLSRLHRNKLLPLAVLMSRLQFLCHKIVQPTSGSTPTEQCYFKQLKLKFSTLIHLHTHVW